MDCENTDKVIYLIMGKTYLVSLEEGAQGFKRRVPEAYNEDNLYLVKQAKDMPNHFVLVHYNDFEAKTGLQWEFPKSCATILWESEL